MAGWWRGAGLDGCLAAWLPGWELEIGGWGVAKAKSSLCALTVGSIVKVRTPLQPLGANIMQYC